MIAFATPIAAFGFLSVAVLTALYCFRRRSPPRTVSSLLLWPLSAERSPSAKRRSRLQTPPLFFLELAALTALVLAALSPFVRRSGGGTLHILRDTSPSMEADTAKDRAERLIAAARRDHAGGATILHEAPDDQTFAQTLAALANSRAPGDEILAVSDHAPADPTLAPGVRWEAVGTPLANLALVNFRRTRREPGRDALLIEARRFGGGATVATLTLDGTRRFPLAFDTNGIARLATDVPTTGKLTATLTPGGALAADDTAHIAPPDVPALAVAISFTNAPLGRLVRRALDATGFVSNYVDAATAQAVFTDCDRCDPDSARKFTVRFLPSGPRRQRASVWVDPSEKLLEGIALDGDPYAISPEPATGRPVAVLGSHPLVTRSERQITLAFSDPALPFFRSSAFPALMQNAMTLAHATLVPAAAADERPLGADESDLTRCASGSFGSPAPDSNNARSRLPLAWVFALLALAALSLHAWLVRSRVTLALLAVTLLALARPVFFTRDRGGTLVVLADRSRSMTNAALAEEERMIRALEATQPKGTALGVVAFGADARIEKRPDATRFEGFLHDLDRDRSDLAPALARAAALAESGRPLRALLLSDGLVTTPGTTPGRQLPPVDSCLLPRPFAHDLAVLSVDAPPAVEPNAVIPVTAWVFAPVAVTNAYALRCGDRILAQGRRGFREGLNPLVFRDFAGGPGLRRYTLAIEPTAIDPCPENNRADFLVHIEGRKPLLLLRNSDDDTAATALNRAGVATEARNVATYAPELATLSGYAGVLIENLPAKTLTTSFQRALRAYVTDLGGSLAMTGGECAFGPGGWHGTTVEEILPVSLELRREHRKYALALAVVLDRSGSMAATLANGRTKMDMANLGAFEAVRMLTAMDEVAVIAVDSAPHVVFGLQPADHAQRSPGQLLGIRSMGGGIFVEQGLLAALRELEKASSPIRHVILFADAADAEEPGDYREYLTAAAKAGVTVSVIGLGRESDCDAPLLSEIASLGGGECWFEANAEEIPRLFMQDTFLTARTAMCTNQTPLRATESLRQLSDVLPAKLPDVGGYNLTYARDDAETAICTADDDHAPLLAFRRAGLGRTLAFTGELSGPHAAPLMTSSVGAELTAAIGRSLRDDRDASSGFTFTRRLDDGGLTLTATADNDEAGDRLAGDRLRATVVIERADGEIERRDCVFNWQTADSLSAFIPLDGDDTAFPAIRFPNGQHQTLGPARLIHAPEFRRPADPEAGRRTLERLGKLTGGRLLATAEECWRSLPRVRHPQQLAPWLYLLTAVTFLALVCQRRLGLSISRPRAHGPHDRQTDQPPRTAPSSGTPSTDAPPTPATTKNATFAALAAASRRLGK